MGIFGFVKNEVRQMAIARPDNVKHLIVYKHPDETIPKWAQLTVDSDEGAVFFKDGRVHGILGAGRHTLDAAMYPFLTGLVDKFGGGDVFKSEVFFVRTQPLRNDPVKFGAQVSMTDPVTQRPCTPMIHGEIVVRVMDPVKFIIGLTGQGHQALDNDVICEYISKKFRSGVRQALASILKEAQTSILEYDMERDRINDGFKARSAARSARASSPTGRVSCARASTWRRPTSTCVTRCCTASCTPSTRANSGESATRIAFENQIGTPMRIVAR